MKTLTVKKLVLLTILSSALAGCGTFSGGGNNVSGISITSFNPETPLGNLYASSQSRFWQNVRDTFSLDHLTNRSEVQEQIYWFQTHPQYTYRVLYHSAPYLYFVSDQVKQRHLPGEIALIPVIESSYNARGTNASSGAAGIWQLMPGTARGFGLKHDFAYDGRRDIFASTDAALTYFNYLHSFFQGDWLLAIAAYDMGEGNVKNHMARNYREGRPYDFWDLSLPKETEIYVPRLLALAAIIQNPSRYHIQLPNVKDGPYFATITMRRQITLCDAAKLAEMSTKELQDLNPEYSHGSTSAYGSYRLILPIDKVDTFKKNFATYQFPERTWFPHWSRHHKSKAVSSSADDHQLATTETVHHKVRKGETLWNIAKRYNIKASELKRLNHLHGSALKPGQEIVIREHVINHVSSSTLAHTEARTQRNKKSGAKHTLHVRSYHVKSGDTLDQIAHQFGVSVRALKAYNGLKSEHLHIGQKLLIPLK